MKSKHKHLLPKLVRWCVPLILILALAIQVPVPARGSDSYVPTEPKVLTALDQETTGLSIYADPDYGFSLNLLTGWSTLPSFSTGRAPGIGGAAFTSVPWHPQMPSLPVLPGQSSVVISLEDANVPVLGDLMAYLRQSFGWTYMESVGEQVLPNGIQVVEASHETGRLFFLRWQDRLYSVLIPWENASEQRTDVLRMLDTLVLEDTETDISVKGLAAIAGVERKPPDRQPTARSSSHALSPPSMRFPWDSAVTDVHYTGGPHGSPWVICGSYSWSGYEGIDFGMSQKELLAVAGGSISSSGYDAVYGNYVVVDHGGGWTTHYWHLQSVGSGIAAGVVVGQGRFLGVSGNTGSGANGAWHLHLSLRLNGAAYAWNDTDIDGWKVRSDVTVANLNNAYNYQGTMTQGTEIWPEIIECGGNAYQHRGSVATAYAAIDGQGTVLTSSNQKNTGSGCCGCGSLATSAKYAANPLLAQLPIFAPTAFASSVTSADRANGSLAMADDATVGARLAGQGRNPGAETPRAGRSPSEEVQRTGRVSPTQQPTARPATVATSPPAELRSDMHSTTIWSREPVVRILWTVGRDAEDSLAGYAIAWDQAPDTQPAATVNLPATTTDATSPLLTTGRWYAHLAAVDRAGNASAVVHAGPFLVDVAAPVWPDGAADTEAVWHNVVAPPRFTWPAAVDEGAGMAGYRVYWGKDPTGTAEPSVVQPAYAPPALSAESTASVRYLRVAAVDAAGNVGAWRTVGISRYDATPPTVALRINNGGETARVLPVTLHLATEDAGSGVAAVRFSPDGANWTAWAPYAVQQGWTLADQPKRQTVYAQVRDAAGNLSETAHASVTAVLNVELPSSTSYRIARSVLGMGGGAKTSASYRVQGTSGQLSGTSVLAGSSYRVRSGFWAGVTCPLAELAAAPNISADGGIVALEWDAVAGVSSYRIYRGTEPYFVLGTPYDTTSNTTWTDSDGGGTPSVNHTYVVKAVNGCGESSTLYRVGEFKFALTPGN